MRCAHKPVARSLSRSLSVCSPTRAARSAATGISGRPVDIASTCNAQARAR